MTQKEMIEIIQQHHPDAGEVIIRKALNRAQDDFAAKTKILTVFTDTALTTITNQRYYDLHPETLEIKRVELDNIEIKRLTDRPLVGDIS